MKNLYVIDATGYLYRSYFAIRNMTNAKGQSTNALYGFLRSLLKLQKDFSPVNLVAVFDGPRSGHHRKTIYEAYKAHRTETPGDLRDQMGLAQKACELLGIPCLVIPDVEADDTMGSIAVWAANQNKNVYLCTSDKDLCQLVTDKIFILNTFKENLIIGSEQVKEIYGVKPEQMIDWLAITGDTSDNIPGLPGFGPKTATALLQEFQTLDHLLEHPELVSGKKQDTIRQFADQARLSRQLVTIHTNVDIPQDPSFFALKPPHLDELKAFYSSMNFHTLLRELEMASPAQEKASATSNVPQKKTTAPKNTLVNDEGTFLELINYLKNYKEIYIATRASHDQPIKAQLVGIGLCAELDVNWYVPLNGNLKKAEVLSKLKPFFENSDLSFVGHNLKFDYQVLANEGIQIKNLGFDVMLASYLLNSHNRQHSLEHLMMEYLGKARRSSSDLQGKGKQMIALQDLPLTLVNEHCGEDLFAIFFLKHVLERQLRERHLDKLLNEIELPLLPILAGMERWGIFVDIPCLHAMSIEVQKLISALAQEIFALVGETFNINSPKQVSEILFTKMGIRAPKKTATGLSTSSDVLESLQHEYPIAGKILEYRTLEKLRSTYLESLPYDIHPKTKRIHCTFNQTVAATGRLSCQDPNLQNIPIRTEVGRKIRTAFRPERPDWSFLAADYSQIELRLLAHLSEDPNMIQAFQRGEDIHAHTASTVFEVPLKEVTSSQRYSAKAVNFGIVYGQQAFGLSQVLGIDVKEASKIIQAYFERFPRIKEYIEASKEQARTTGRSVTLTGRERLIPEIKNKNMQIRAAAERLAVNTPLQGTAADLIKLAMLHVAQVLKKESSRGAMILQIHDELIFELPDDEIERLTPLIRNAMQDVMQLKVPLVVDISIGKNWAEC